MLGSKAQHGLESGGNSLRYDNEKSRNILC